jgi:hypothetical protein
MTAYSVLIEDDRYGVPTLQFVVGDDLDLSELARRCLQESPHHLRVTIDIGGRELLSLAQNVEAEPASPAAAARSPIFDAAGAARRRG